MFMFVNIILLTLRIAIKCVTVILFTKCIIVILSFIYNIIIYLYYLTNSLSYIGKY